MASIQYFRLSAKFLRLLGVRLYRRGLLHGVAAAIEHAGIVRRLKPDLVLDVGANVGQFSLLARNEAPNARIIAFEPLREPSARYRGLFAHDERVTLHRFALGCARGEVDMHLSARMDSSSLLPISRLQVEHFPGTEEIGCEKVKVAPVTDFIQDAELIGRTFVKIDVQGFELDVLRSAEPLLPRLTWIYVELSSIPLYEGQALAVDTINFLERNGFRLLSRYNAHLSSEGEVIQADYLFHNVGRSG
jgi:FkbM family methyltransferase